MLKPGNKNSQVTEMFAAVASTFGCNVVQAVLSHQMKRFVIDGNKTIISKSDVDHKVEEFEFEVNDVFALDVVMTTGEGKPKEVDERVTVFKRAVDKTYQLKLKVFRLFFVQIYDRLRVNFYLMLKLDTLCFLSVPALLMFVLNLVLRSA